MADKKVITLSLAVAVLVPAGAGAHRLDELLQTTFVSVGADRVRVDVSLTPGAQIASKVVGRIDADSDGAFSAAEREAFARQVVDAIEVTIDGQRSALTLDGAQFPLPADLAAGTASVRINAFTPAPATGSHQMTVENGFERAMGVYLMEIRSPEPGTTVERQIRDPLQRTVRVDYAVRPSRQALASALIVLLLIAGGASVVLRARRRFRKA
jgi:hypothetical protein